MKLFIKLAVPAAIVTYCVMEFENPPSERAEALVRIRMFEAPQEVVDTIIPRDARKPLDESTYMAVEANPATVSSLLDGMVPEPGLLVDEVQHVIGWLSADSWVCSRADTKLLGTSLGTGVLGVRTRDEIREIRIEYDISHRIDSSRRGGKNEPKAKGTLPIEEKIYYEGPVPPEKSIIFMKPFVRTDGTELVHLVVSELVKWGET